MRYQPDEKMAASFSEIKEARMGGLVALWLLLVKRGSFFFPVWFLSSSFAMRLYL